MKLSSPELIQALIALERTAAPMPAPPAPRREKRRTRCQCGHCRDCAENARWERIFAEKFADPDYYSGLVVRTESPLRSF